MKRISYKLPQPVQLPSGSWRVRVEVDGKRLSFTDPDPLVAQQMALAAKAGVIQAKKEACAKGKTLAQAIDDYLESLSNTLSPSTLRGYRSVRENRVQSLMPLYINDITPSQYQRALDIEKRTLSPKTVRNIWGLIHAVLTAEGLPTPSVKLPQKIKNTRPFLDDQQLKLFLSEIEDDPAEIPLLLALHSLRRSEILGLRWQDVDLKNGIIHVNGSMVYNEYHEKVWKQETKNSGSRRYVRIVIPRLLDLLQSVPDKDGYVTTMPELTIYKHANYACKRADLPAVGIHGLRHTFASLCYHLGMQEKTIMEMGGWSDPTILRDIYTHMSAHKESLETDKLRSFYSR